MTNRIEGTAAPISRAVAAVGAGQVGRAGESRDKPVEAASPADSLRLTGEATGLAALQRDLATKPAFDEARVQALRESIASGNYKVDAEAIATRMLDLDARLAG